MKGSSQDYRELRLILGDQLNAGHSWYKQKDNSVLYLIAELHQETGYVRHHCQKICAFFAAMQAFAQGLQKAGHQVLHLTLDETAEFADLPALINSLCSQYSIKHFAYQRPDEYRLQQQLQHMSLPAGASKTKVDSEHFLLPFEEIPKLFKQGKHQKMEFFYRKMRKRFDLLMQGDQPTGGQWNYDSDNRKKLKAGDIEAIPQALLFSHDVSGIMQRLRKHKVGTIGTEGDELAWPVTRRESLQLLQHFCLHCLPLFGTFQDAMTANSPQQWSLYHSRLSFALNAKILHPKQVIDTAINHYETNKSSITLAQIEGFVRQILGWREFVRGVYWVNMPGYANTNQLQASRPLPNYFWTGKTKMRCLHHTIQQSLDYSYAHHIQRLMVTGNFCLLAGIDPKAIDEWYLGIYNDAIEWVQLPNTRGMSQFADGGIVATKPYAASGNYIQKMSDYCGNCHYQVKEKATENACPLNSLYWHFMNCHRPLLEENPRIGMVYRNWDKQGDESRTATLERAQWCLENIQVL